MDFTSFFSAIAGQESGGNYSAVNGRTGALGKYQILPGNIGPWSKQYLGYSVTPQAFLHSPTLQEKLAGAVLHSYYNRYGARGAAAAWYSGDYRKANDYTRFRSNEPSIGEYVDQVLGRVGGGSSYGYIKPVASTFDNRVQQSNLTALLSPQDSTASTAAGVQGADKSGAAGLDAPTGGAGMEAAMPTLGDLAQPASVQPQFQPGSTPNPGRQVGGQRAALIDMARQFVGTPYVWGGARPGGFDCSGLIQYAMKQIGVNFPRVSYDQLQMGHRTSVSDLKPGDLVGFGDGGHIAIYLGGGQILEAPRTGLDVRVRSLGKGEKAWGVSLDGIYR